MFDCNDLFWRWFTEIDLQQVDSLANTVVTVVPVPEQNFFFGLFFSPAFVKDLENGFFVDALLFFYTAVVFCQSCMNGRAHHQSTTDGMTRQAQDSLEEILQWATKKLADC